MDLLDLFFAGPPMALFFLGLGLPFFGNKKDLEALVEEKKSLEKQNEKLESRVAELKKKLEKANGRASDIETQLAELRTRNDQLKGEAQKIARLEKQLAERSNTAATLIESKDRLLATLQEEILSLKQANADLQEQIALIEKGPQPAPEPIPEPVIETPVEAPPQEAPPVVEEPRVDTEKERLRESVGELQDSLRKLKREFKEQKERNRLLKRMAEHNRRAYVVTLSQLDLSQDEICLLKTGKPRRQTQQSQNQVPMSEEPSCPPANLEEATPEPQTADELAAETEVVSVQPPVES